MPLDPVLKYLSSVHTLTTNSLNIHFNKILKFGTLMYSYNYYVSGRYSTSCSYPKHTTLRRLGSVSVFRWNLISWAKSVELVPIFEHQRRVEAFVTTDGQSASVSWNKAPIWGLPPDSYYCQTVRGLLMWCALFYERTGLSFPTALALASASTNTKYDL
jgi:hypothetical protein